MGWEFKRGWRSFRFPGFLLLLLFFALMDPPVIKYMEPIVSRFGGGVKIQLPPPTARLAFMQFLQDLAQLCGFGVILLVAGSVASEKKSGLAAWYLLQPVGRTGYLLDRFFAYGSVIVGGAFGAGLLSYLYACTLLEPFPLLEALGALAATCAFLLFLGSCAFFGSLLFSSGGAAFFGFAVGFGGFLFLSPAKALGFAHFLPQNLPGVCPLILAGTYPEGDLILGIIFALLWSGLLLGLGLYLFSRMELGRD